MMNKKGILSKVKLCLSVLFAVIFVFTGFVYYRISWGDGLLRFMFVHSNVSAQCIIPIIDPFEKETMKLFHRPNRPLGCGKPPNFISLSANGTLGVNLSMKSISCTYRLLVRISDYDIKFNKEEPFNGTENIPGEFFRLICRRNRLIVYDNLHFQLKPNKLTKSNTAFQDESDEQLSVMLFGIDSLSRLTALRKIPKTLDYIERKLGAYTFLGYTKVGENTFPNLVSILTGLKAYSNEVPKMNFKKEYFDKTYPFIWKKFTQKGYAFSFAEDRPDISIFNMDKKGFDNQPSNHYLRPFYFATYRVGTSVKGINGNHPLCYGGKPKFLNILYYIQQFMDLYPHKLRFSLSFLTQLTHDDVNQLDHGDEGFVNFFKYLKNGKHLEKSIVFVFSDHGARMNTDIRNSPSGRIEDRMPLMSLIIPEHLKKKYPNLHDKLLKNSKDVLTTPYDVFETLKSILNGNFEDKIGFPRGESLPRGISFFRSIPTDRSCADAGVPENYCPCYVSNPLNTSLKIIRDVSENVIKSINTKLEIVGSKCAKLSLAKVLKAWEVSSGLNRDSLQEFLYNPKTLLLKSDSEPTKRYTVLLQTSPGNGMFDASVNVRFKNSSDIEVLGDIVRTNTYGKQSWCTDEKLLKPFCYCKRQKIT